MTAALINTFLPCRWEHPSFGLGVNECSTFRWLWIVPREPLPLPWLLEHCTILQIHVWGQRRTLVPNAIQSACPLPQLQYLVTLSLRHGTAPAGEATSTSIPREQHQAQHVAPALHCSLPPLERAMGQRLWLPGVCSCSQSWGQSSVACHHHTRIVPCCKGQFLGLFHIPSWANCPPNHQSTFQLPLVHACLLAKQVLSDVDEQ